jgi:uncharacterized protein (TIGR02145 family)
MPIPLVTDDTEWGNLATGMDDLTGRCIGMGAYCWYNNDSASYNSDYGKLYNWFAVETSKLCPIGWHVSGTPFQHSIIDCTCFDEISGLCDGDLMETGTAHWTIIYPCITNETGFTALPGGRRTINGFYTSVVGFSLLGSVGEYWTSNDMNGFYGCLAMYYPIPRIFGYGGTPQSTLRDKETGLSVRCVKD